MTRPGRYLARWLDRAPTVAHPEMLAVVGATAVLVLLLVGFGLADTPAWRQPGPTPASLAPRATPFGDRRSPSSVAVPPALSAVGAPDRRRVRLRHDVLVRTQPGADSERPAIAMLGAGMTAEVVEQRDDWILVGIGPLIGWTQLEGVDFVR